MTSRVLVVGAGGSLGAKIARTLLSRGHAVRAFGRTASRLAPLASLGAEVVAGDLLDAGATMAACSGVGQIVSTANNVMGRGRTSPNRVDLPAYRNLCRAAADRRVARLIHISAYGLTSDNPVDYFRVKWRIDELIRTSGVPWVLVRPAAFMDTWVRMMVDQIRRNGTVLLFGRGDTRSTFIAESDVARFVARIVERQEIMNEAIDVGGPSTATFVEVADLVERQLGKPVQRRRVPLGVLRLFPLVRPFNELAARFMALGYWAATADNAMSNWAGARERLEVEPTTVEQYVQNLMADQRASQSQ